MLTRTVFIESVGRYQRLFFDDAAHQCRPIHPAGSHGQGAARPQRFDRDGLRLVRLGKGQERWDRAHLDTALPEGP
jgi:hypothetical protein